MPGFTATAFVDHAFFGRIEKDLLRMEAIDRSPAVKKGMRNAVGIPAKRVRQKLYGLLPYRGDKKGKKPLASAVGTRVYQDDVNGGIVGRVRWRRPEGSHGHLVEAGHRIVVGGSLHKKPKTSRRNSRLPQKPRRGAGKVSGRVEGRRYLANAWEETREAQNMALEAGVKEGLTGKK